MTTGTTTLLAWFRQSSNKNPLTTNATASGPSTTRRSNVPPRKHKLHTRRTCFKCKQRGHYARDCPYVANQKPTETKMKRMQYLLESMTTTERTEFKKYVLSDEDKLQTKTTTIPLNRETKPRANRTFIGVPPSRETGPHTCQTLTQFTKISERCKECDGMHPTRICMKRFLKPQKPELTPPLTHDDDSTGSDTLYDSEGSEDNEVELTTDPSTQSTKMVTFELPIKKPTRDSTTHHADESEDDDNSNDDSIDIQQPNSQSDEADMLLRS